MAIRSLCLFSQTRSIFIITAPGNFAFFEEQIENGLTDRADNKDSKTIGAVQLYLLDENQLIAEVSLQSIRDILKARVDYDGRAGWYFQQFLKMAICDLVELADHYLIWDSDTVALAPMTFFNDQDQILVQPSGENHQPYFDFTQRTLGFKRQVKFSFVSEHMMVRKAYMIELIQEFMARAPEGVHWVEYILGSVESQHLFGSGFSEYETYGNYVAQKYPGEYLWRQLKSTRFGAIDYGPDPQKYEVFHLMQLENKYVTFELGFPGKPRVIAFNRLKARLSYAWNRLLNRQSKRMSAADEIGHG